MSSIVLRKDLYADDTSVAQTLCGAVGRVSCAQPFRAAHVWIAGLVEAKRPLHLSRQAYPHAFSDWSWLPHCLAKPKRTVGAQVCAITFHVDPHRGRQPARPSREVKQACCTSLCLHKADPLQRLEGAQKHAGAYPRQLARDVVQV